LRHVRQLPAFLRQQAAKKNSKELRCTAARNTALLRKK